MKNASMNNGHFSGFVSMGVLKEGKEVAVKRLFSNSEQGVNEFFIQGVNSSTNPHYQAIMNDLELAG